jgi:radical SAM protein with 4Fe4S-binding SPASM domain
MRSPSAHSRTLRLLFWESTIRCNLSCAHCRRIEGDNTADSDLTSGQAAELIDRLAAMGRAQAFMPILVFSGGEPLCRGDLFELIERAHRKELRCALATNGTLIDAAMAGRIRSAGVDRVSVSLDGTTAEVHNKLRRQEGSFEAAVEGMERLREEGVPFQINMTMTRYNAHQPDELFEFARRAGAAAVHLFMLVPVGCGEEFDEADMLSADEYEELLRQVARKEPSAGLEVKVTCGPHYERIIREQGGSPSGRMSRGCLAGSGVLFVSHSGQVFPCGYLPIDCGHILETPLERIWKESEHLARMRDPEQLKGKCGACGCRGVCGGCRARAFAATGDYMEEEPMCRYEPPKRPS